MRRGLYPAVVMPSGTELRVSDRRTPEASAPLFDLKSENSELDPLESLGGNASHEARRTSRDTSTNDGTMAFHTVVSTMETGELILVILACGIGALLIGAVGIGGVVILPALLVAGVNPAVGILSLYVAFVPAACAKLLVLGRIRGLIPWTAALSCGSTAAVGAAIGGVLVESSPRRTLMYLVGVFAALAGLRDAHELIQRRRKQRRDALEGGPKEPTASGSPPPLEDARTHDAKGDDASRGAVMDANFVNVEISAPPPPPPATLRERIAVAYMSTDSIPAHLRWNPTRREMAILAAMGLVIGCASVLTGTGGPLILIPVLLTWKGDEAISRKVIVGCSSVLAACLVVSAVIAMTATGVRPDAGLALLIAPCAVIGMATGASILQVASREALQAAMTVLLLAVAALTISKAATD